MGRTRFHRIMEIAKLTVSVTVPVAIVLCGYLVQRSVADFESHRAISMQISVKLADRRLSVYDKIKEPLNQVYCYIEEICDWQNLSAEEIKEIRKRVNRVMYSDRAVWSTKTFRLYIRYMDDVAFQIQGDGHDSKIRAEINNSRIISKKWSEDSRVLLTGEKSTQHRTIYHQLNESLSEDLMLSEIIP